MGIIDRNTVKSYFERGDQPTEAQFVDWIDSEVSHFPTMQDLVDATQSANANNQLFALKGFYSSVSGGGGLFYWDASQSKANHNGGTIIDPNHSSTPGASGWWSDENTGNGCYVRIYDNTIDVKWFGAKGDNTNDDYDAIRKTIDVAISSGVYNVNIPYGIYYVSSEVGRTFSASEKQCLFIDGNGSTIRRDYSDLSADGSILRLQGIEQGTQTVTSDISVGDSIISVSDTSSIEKGMYFYLRTDELYTTRDGGPSGYDKGYMGYITEIIDATTVRVNVNFPISFSSSSTLELLFYSKSNIGIDNLNVEWSGDFTATSNNATGLEVLRLSGIKLKNITAKGADNRDISLSLCYDVSSENVNTESIQDTDNQLSYGLSISGLWDSTIKDSNLVSSRHSVTITGYSNSNILFDGCVFDSLGESSGVSFDSHVAESLLVANSKITRGINISAGDYVFKECSISNGKGGRQAVVNRRDASFQKSLTLKDCNIEIYSPSSGDAIIYNLDPGSVLEDYGDFVMEGCEINSEGAYNIIASLNGDDGYNSVGLFYIASNKFNDSIGVVVVQSGYSSPSGDKGNLVLTNNSFKDVDTVGGHHIFDYLEATDNRPIDSGGGDTCRFVVQPYDTAIVIKNIINGECRLRGNGTVVYGLNVTINTTENNTYAHNFESNTLLHLYQNIVIDSVASYGFNISGNTKVVGTGNRFKDQAEDLTLYGPTTPSIQGSIPVFNYDNNSEVKQNHALSQRDLIKTGSGTPVGSLTPDFVGQRYQDTSTSSPRKIYESTGVTNSDWEALN